MTAKFGLFIPSFLPRLILLAGPVAYAGTLFAGWWAISGHLPDQMSCPSGHAFTVKHIHESCWAAGASAPDPAVRLLDRSGGGGLEEMFAARLTAPTPSLKTDIAFFLMDQVHLTGLWAVS